jgi:hypothetical protein
MLKHLAILSVLLVILCLDARAQGSPTPVDVPIQNIHQETEVWCWAAVAQQIIMASRGQSGTPSQCALVAMANRSHPDVCCRGYNRACVVTGSLTQIQWLIGRFGGRPTNYAMPADSMTLYRTLLTGRAVILQLRTSDVSSHVVVLRGMSFVPTASGWEPVLHINDPMARYTQPVLFSRILPVWKDAIVVN